MLFEEGTVEALDVAVRLRPADRGGAVFDLLELQEELIGVLVRPTAVLASVEGRIRWIAQDWTFRPWSSKNGSA